MQANTPSALCTQITLKVNQSAFYRQEAGPFKSVAVNTNIIALPKETGQQFACKFGD